jgi:hypothetical protein
MVSKRLLVLLSLLTPTAFAGTASAQATDIGVVQGQGTPNQPPPFQGTPNQPPPFQGTPNQPPPYQPPPQYPPPQQEYRYQPQQQPYGQPQYQQAQPQRAPGLPYRKPYKDGDPIPDGYHVEEKPRTGLAVGGWLLLLIPYGISALSALAAKGDNQTNWLYLPVAGPWMMMGLRHYASSCHNQNGDHSDGLNCVADVFVVTGLIVDGLMQAGGTAMLLAAYLNPKEELVRDHRALLIKPTRIGSGYGLGLISEF